MTSFVALYRGETIGAAQLVAVSAEPELVRNFADRLLATPGADEDPVILELEQGRRRALQLVKSESE